MQTWILPDSGLYSTVQAHRARHNASKLLGRAKVGEGGGSVGAGVVREMKGGGAMHGRFGMEDELEEVELASGRGNRGTCHPRLHPVRDEGGDKLPLFP